MHLNRRANLYGKSVYFGLYLTLQPFLEITIWGAL